MKLSMRKNGSSSSVISDIGVVRGRLKVAAKWQVRNKGVNVLL